MNDPRDLDPAAPAEARQPVFNAPAGTVWLCVAIIVAHALFSLAPQDWQITLLERFAFIPALFFAGGASPGSLLRLVSYAFLHGDALHLIVNAGMILAFGSLVERAVGTGRFLVIYFATAVAAALLQALAVGPEMVLVIGASGAGYGLIGAGIPYLYAGRVHRGRRDLLLFVAAIMGLNLLFGLVGLGAMITGAAIAWQAHIGGFLAGLVLIRLLAPRRG